LSSSLADRWTFLDKIIQNWRFRKIYALIPEGCLLADLGCGDGSFLRYIKGKVTSAYGVDMNIDYALGSGGLIFQCGDLNQEIPLKAESVDVVTALAIIEHLKKPEKFMKEIRRILKPGGCCILTTPSPRAKPLLEFLASKLKIISEKDIRHHKTYFTKSQLHDIFAEFHSMKVSSFQFGLNTLVVAFK
jgi:2-polyprenyl-3-methyl-5-hydroxy-6-metoxy-1,4-benzoquinol methylase